MSYSLINSRPHKTLPTSLFPIFILNKFCGGNVKIEANLTKIRKQNEENKSNYRQPEILKDYSPKQSLFKPGLG
jgi:hypothetical protein